MSKKNKNLKGNIIALFIGCILSFISAELLLRFTTNNIYKDMSVINDEITKGVRLHWPMRNSINVEGLYEGSGEVDFTIDEKRYVYPGYENIGQDLALFFGGSTTESVTVREGVRFSDLTGKSLNLYPMNYGKSGNNSLESFLNLKYLFKEFGYKPRIVFMLHGVNDFGIFLKSGGKPDVISNINVLLDTRNGSRNQEFIKQRINSWIRKSYVVAHVYIAMKAMGDSYLEKLIKDGGSQSDNMASDDDFKSFVQSPQFQSFLMNRKETYKKFIGAAKENGSKVVIYTQPVTYTEKYKSYVGFDLRIFPITLKGKRMNIAQARRLYDIISKNTREAAEEGNALLIDLDKLFSQMDPSPLIYDTLHYTEKGSKLIAEYTAQEIKKANFLEDNVWLQ
jgi:lysophospholipase L1-like esterase